MCIPVSQPQIRVIEYLLGIQHGWVENPSIFTLWLLNVAMENGPFTDDL